MKSLHLFHKSTQKAHEKARRKNENKKKWSAKLNRYEKRHADKEMRKKRKRREREQWRRSSKTFNFTYKIFFNMVFYAKQGIKAFAWLFFLGMFPKWTITEWMHGLVMSNTNGKVFFAEITSMHYWNIIIAATTLFAIWKILHLQWRPPVVKMTIHDLSIIKEAKKKQRRQERCHHEEQVLYNAKEILGLNKSHNISQNRTSQTIKPTKNAIHRAKNKLKHNNEGKHFNDN